MNNVTVPIPHRLMAAWFVSHPFNRHLRRRLPNVCLYAVKLGLLSHSDFIETCNPF